MLLTIVGRRNGSVKCRFTRLEMRTALSDLQLKISGDRKQVSGPKTGPQKIADECNATSDLDIRYRLTCFVVLLKRNLPAAFCVHKSRRNFLRMFSRTSIIAYCKLYK